MTKLTFKDFAGLGKSMKKFSDFQGSARTHHYSHYESAPSSSEQHQVTSDLWTSKPNNWGCQSTSVGSSSVHIDYTSSPFYCYSVQKLTIILPPQRGQSTESTWVTC